MAEGVLKRHSRECPARKGKRCRCNAGYEAWVYLSRENRKVRRTFARESEAKSWRAEALSAAGKGGLQPVSRDARTLYEALVEFVEGMEDGSVRPRGRERYKPNTVRSYERAVRLHLAVSDLGRLRPIDVRRRDVQAFVDELLRSGISARSASNVLNPILAFYRRGMNRDELAYNPTQGIELPSGAAKRPRRIVPPAEAAALLAALPVEDRALWATAFYAGLRRGELQALRCKDIDLGASLIHVRRGWDQVAGEIEPKSTKGVRTVPLLAVLRDHVDEHLLRTGRAGEDRIFGRSAQQVFYASTVDVRARKAWEAHNAEEREAAEQAGRKPRPLTLLTMHECRHTFASLLIDTGANAKAIQEVMGHSKIQTTFDIYGHLLPGSHDEVRVRMDAYLDRVAEEGLPAGDSD